MCRFENIKADLKQHMKTSRYEHTLRVVEEASKLAKIYNLNEEKVKIAAILHDCAKGKESYFKELYKDEYNLLVSKNDFKEFKNPFLEHSILGAIVARNKYKVTDKEILDSIIYHTTGRVSMTDFEKVVYLADKTEMGRNYPGVEKIREMSLINLNNAIILNINNTIEYLIEKNQEISIKTVKLRNNLVGGYIGR
ncbi:bis(5'-nucleosyl)-tetraphosphatase (symmetrical) YqeK [Peptostreptococcaceae bacterium OttesenSCG-928-C18]|nr:bis(5'-nucleosyl)-tetraphosphatase (symmetrical) YqeK [Peptostreptococcaceae bacterium OttesenSCG-928-C18]